MAWTKEECEADALHSHEKVVGTVISVSSVEVFMNGVIQHHVTTNPLTMRVLETPQEFLLIWSGEYLDARWYVEPVKPTDGIEGATDPLGIRPCQLAHRARARLKQGRAGDDATYKAQRFYSTNPSGTGSVAERSVPLFNARGR